MSLVNVNLTKHTTDDNGLVKISGVAITLACLIKKSNRKLYADFEE